MIRRVSRLPSLPRDERQLAVRAAVLGMAAALLVRFIPWPASSRAVARLHRLLFRGGPNSESISLPRAASIIERAAGDLPLATCLSLSLTGQALLADLGYEPTLRVGIRQGGATLDAHAWLEVGGAAILGAPEPGTFQPFAPLPR